MDATLSARAPVRHACTRALGNHCMIQKWTREKAFLQRRNVSFAGIQKPQLGTDGDAYKARRHIEYIIGPAPPATDSFLRLSIGSTRTF